jgi:TRAP transporter 4TM/12TM fusion protein
MRELTGKIKLFIYAYCVLVGLFHLYTAMFGAYEAYLQRSLHLASILPLAFLLYPISKRAPRNSVPWYDWLMAFIAVLPGLYSILRFDHIANRFIRVDPVLPVELCLGLLLVLVLLEAARRLVGLPLTLVAGSFFLYMVYGYHLPGTFEALPFSLAETIEVMYLSDEGIFSIPLGVSSTYVVIFLIFGGFLEKSGIGAYFMNIAVGLAGTSPGGPAKIAVVSSCLFGSISGSAVANVYGTGTFTIPLMKRIGYPAAFAGGVEATASTGGQLMPPVMGAAAFVMASLMGVQYKDVMIAALLPAILYYLAVFITVHLRAVKLRMRGMSREDIPSKESIGRNLYKIIPVIVILYMLLAGYTPMWAALVSIFATWIVSLPDAAFRMGPKAIADAIYAGIINVPTIAIACAVAGIVVGSLTTTGFGFKFVAAVFSLAHGAPFIALIMMALISLVLGMGLPTTGAYILAASLGVPALVKLGFSLMGAHMFCFYFAILSAITPPVALASFAGASLAKAPPNDVSLAAVRLGCLAFLIPFAFMYDPGLLLESDLLGNIVSIFAGIGFCCCLGWAFEGYICQPISLPLRLTMIPLGVLCFMPSPVLTLTGVACIAAIGVYHRVQWQKGRASAVT